MPEGEPGNTGPGGAASANGASGAAAGVTEERMNEAISKALSARFRDFKSEVSTLISETVGKSSKETTDAVNAALEGLPDKLKELGFAPAQKPKGGEGHLTDDAVKESPAFKGLQRELDAQKKVAADIVAKAEAKTKAARASTLRQSLLEELAEHHIDGHRGKRAADLLIAGGHVSFASDNEDETEINFTHADKTVVDFKTGIKEWVGTEDGMIFVPPSGAAGSGGPPARGQRPPTNGQPRMDAPGALGAALLGAATGRSI